MRDNIIDMWWYCGSTKKIIGRIQFYRKRVISIAKHKYAIVMG